MFDTYGPNSPGFQFERQPIHKRALISANKIDSDFTKKVLNSLKNHLYEFFKYSLCRICLRMNYPIPHKLRYWYIEKNNFRIMLNYRPDPYNGSITLFESTFVNDEKHGWQEVAQGEFRTIKLKGDHNRFIEMRKFGQQFSSILKSHQPT
jgi:hypothetical protein